MRCPKRKNTLTSQQLRSYLMIDKNKQPKQQLIQRPGNWWKQKQRHNWQHNPIMRNLMMKKSRRESWQWLCGNKKYTPSGYALCNECIFAVSNKKLYQQQNVAPIKNTTYLLVELHKIQKLYEKMFSNKVIYN